MSKKVQGGYDATSSKIRSEIAKAKSALRRAKTPAQKRAAMARLDNWERMAARSSSEKNKRHRAEYDRKKSK